MSIPRTSTGAIYFIRSCGMMKIGRTTGNLRGRVQSVIANCPFPSVYLGAYVVTNAHKAETEIHAALKADGHHVHSEWFTVPDWLDLWTDSLDRNISRIERAIDDLDQIMREFRSNRQQV